MLVAKIVKKFNSGNAVGVDSFVKTWSILNNAKACAFTNLVLSDNHPVFIFKHLSVVHKSYKKSKIHESRLAKEASIRKAIEKQMEKFCSDKGGIIKNVLDQLFHKVVLNHLVVDDELVVEPTKVKSNIDRIMESWTRKRKVPPVLPDHWAYQYALLNYIRNNTFSGVMHSIGLNNLLLVISGLLDGKAAGLSGIPNEL
ncbi:hypothetical protein G9A89_012482 [Geosiphon pyriformis]|nr:hypothetical protein G9A89_012482 [Geosiphon pyriformis]